MIVQPDRCPIMFWLLDARNDETLGRLSWPASKNQNMNGSRGPYSITSSASAVSVAGISSPIDFAVFKLMTNW